MRKLLYGLFCIIGAIVLIFISRLFGDGGGSTPPAEAVAVVGVVMSSTRFWVLTITGVFILVVWAVVNIATCQDNWRIRLRNCSPPAWAFAVLLGVTVFHWLFWAISPGAWSAWLSSQTFWPMNVAIILAAFFASQQDSAARYTRLALWILLLMAVAVGVYGQYGHYRTPPSPVTSVTSDTTFVVTVRSGQPAEVKMTPGQMIVWWGDKSKFTSRAVWRGENKVRVFVARTGVESAEIKIHRYYDPDPNWWRRQ